MTTRRSITSKPEEKKSQRRLTQKDYMGSVDGGAGGVGFAIPAGWVGEEEPKKSRSTMSRRNIGNSHEQNTKLARRNLSLPLENDATTRNAPAYNDSELLDDINYRLAIESSPRVCGNCRFFQNVNGLEGDCSIYKFTARANHVCDAWQSSVLSSSHIPMRDENNRKTDQQSGEGVYASRSLARPSGVASRKLRKSTRGVGNWGDKNITPNTAPDNRYSVGRNPALDNRDSIHEQYDNLAPLEYQSVTADGWQQGVVRGQRVTEDERGYITRTINYNKVGESSTDIDSATIAAQDNQILKMFYKYYLPGDTVYSKSNHSLAVVDKAVDDTDTDVGRAYIIKLIDQSGVYQGVAIAYANDLMPRGNMSVKTGAKRAKTIDIEGDVKKLITIVRELHQRLVTICDRHSDYLKSPLSNIEVLNPLMNDIIAILDDEIFRAIRTGPRRKYFRALQESMVSIGAARQILFNGYNALTTLRESLEDASPDSQKSIKENIREILRTSQTDANHRVQNAAQMLYDSLTIDSATHNTPAPQLVDE